MITMQEGERIRLVCVPSMRAWIMHLIEALLCCLVGLVFLAIYVGKQTLPRWEPRVPETPQFRVVRPAQARSLDEPGHTEIPMVPLILIHGYASSPLIFSELKCIQPLLAEGHTVVLPTYRERVDGPDISLGRVLTHSLLACLPRDALPVSIETMAADLVVMMTENKWEKVHLVGHSMGGMVAQAVAIEVPERVASLTTIGSCTGPGLGPCGPRVLQLVRDGMRVMYPALWQRLTGDIGGALGEGQRPGTHAEANARQGRSEWGQRQVGAIITSRDRAKKLDALVRRGRLHAPIFAVSGDQDMRISPASAAAMGRRITGCRSVVVGGMEHSPQEDEWTEVLRLAGLISHHNAMRNKKIDADYVQNVIPSMVDEYKDHDVDVLEADAGAEPSRPYPSGASR